MAKKRAKSRTTKTHARRMLTARAQQVIPPAVTDRVFGMLGQIAERVAGLERRLTDLEQKVGTTPSMMELKKLTEELVQIRVFADHAEQRISNIADRANFVPSEFVDRATWNGWRNGFDERLRALEKLAPAQ